MAYNEKNLKFAVKTKKDSEEDIKWKALFLKCKNWYKKRVESGKEKDESITASIYKCIAIKKYFFERGQVNYTCK